MENIKNSLVPLKFIRIAKDMSSKDFAEYFLVSPAYISAIEKGQRQMHPRTIKSGLRDMGIEFEDYLELEQLAKELNLKDIEEGKKYRIMLIKAIGVADTSLKDISEQLLDTYYRNKKIKLGNGLVLTKHHMK